MPHGDVVPQTPQSEAGRDFVDDTSLFENMMSPNKIAKHGDGPGSVNLLGQLRQIEHLDIEPDVVLQSKILSWILMKILMNLFQSSATHEGTQLSLQPTRATTWTWWTSTTGQHCRSSWDWTFVWSSCLTWRHPTCWCEVPEHTFCAHLAQKEGRCWQCNRVEEKQTCGKGIHLVATRQRSLVLTGFIQHCNQDLAHLFSYFEGNIKRFWCLQLMWRMPSWQLSKSNPYVSGALTQVEPRFPTVLAEFCQVNVMVAFSGTKIYCQDPFIAAMFWPLFWTLF